MSLDNLLQDAHNKIADLQKQLDKIKSDWSGVPISPRGYSERIDQLQRENAGLQKRLEEANTRLLTYSNLINQVDSLKELVIKYSKEIIPDLQKRLEELHMPKMFPVQRSLNRDVKPYPRKIPWSIAELAYSVYSSRYGDDQSLERLAERHGFAPEEMDDFVPDWREQCDKIMAARAALTKIRIICKNEIICYGDRIWKGMEDVDAIANKGLEASK